MNASKNTRIGALVVGAVALVAAGGALAAGKHHGSKAAAQGGLSIGSYVSSQAGGTTRNDGRGFGMGRGFGHGFGMSDDLAAAAAYLGVTASDLQTSLQSGKTLAEVADATSGKSAAGLIAALTSHEQDELKAAVAAGKLTQAQADAMQANLTSRMTNFVNGTGPMGRGPGGPGFGHGFGMSDDLAAAAAYLGVTASDLQTSLQSGKTLAEVADATSGKSAAGLIAALTSHEQDELKAAVAAGKLTQAQADAMQANLTSRMTNFVNGTGGPKLGREHGFGRGFGPGGPPPGAPGAAAAPAGTHI